MTRGVLLSNRRPRAFSLVAFALAALVACDGSTGPDVPAVATIRVTPELSFLDLGDTVRLTATAFSESGDPIPDAELTWSSGSPAVSVDGSGRVTGIGPGVAQVDATSGSAVGQAEIRVSPVATMTPDTGRYGTVVTLEGDDVLARTVVYFPGAEGDRLRAQVRSTSAGAIELWVPVGAVSGPLWLEWDRSAGQTAAEFRLTAESDVLAGGGAVPVPYYNPSLLADGTSPHEVSFTLEQDGPFTVEVIDRGPRAEPAAIRAWLFRTDVQPSVLMSFVMTWDQVAGGAPLDSVAYSRASLPAGDYTVLVAPLDIEAPERTDVTRPFGLRLAAAERFGRPPDDREPNDYPGEAPTLPLPYSSAGAGFETPYGMDHYAFEVDDPTTVRITTVAADALVLVYLFPAGVTDILEAWDTEQVLATAETTSESRTVTATLPPGRYTALIWDWGGRARPYDLEIGGEAEDAGHGRPTPAGARGGHPVPAGPGEASRAGVRFAVPAIPEAARPPRRPHADRAGGNGRLPSPDREPRR